MSKKNIISLTQKYIKQVLPEDCTAHDWRHAERVRRMALYIATREKLSVNRLVINLTTLLHDLDDWKFVPKTIIKSSRARQWLTKLKLDSHTIEHICAIIREMPFRGAKVPSKMSTLEGKIIQDADWLDALGAIGIARAFAYGGFKKRLIYNPRVLPKLHRTFVAYRSDHSSTINHFYTKLLVLKHGMNTKTARVLARKRHQLLQTFLRQFFSEWV